MQLSFSRSRGALLLSTALCALFASESVEAQEVSGFQTSDELIVYGTVVHRNRTEAVAPNLSYDLEYFQRFEPISAGDALKRVPGVSFTSDTLEYDEVQMRGLPSIYTQVQVNGQNLSGGGNDRVFFVDRIPAELIDTIEIIRSPSADMSSEGIGGTVNATLKRAGQIKGGWVRGSAFAIEGDELRGAGSVGYGNTFGDVSYLFSVDVQQRRNPKEKVSYSYTPDGVFDGYETQSDTRDGTDYAFNGEVLGKVGEGSLRLYGFFVLTDRTETEYTQAFDDTRALDSVETQLEDINQYNLSVASEYTLPVGSDEFKFIVGYNRFVEDNKTTEHETDAVPFLFKPSATELTDTVDQDWFSTLAYTANFNELVSVKFGVDGRIKTRDFNQQLFDGDGVDESLPNGKFDIVERRVDPYAKATWKPIAGLSVETGLRFEYTQRELSGPDYGSSDADFSELNPSLHVLYALTDTTNLRFSLARTVRRPTFDSLIPATLEEEPTDDYATIGNPDLKQETAWGIDTGFEQKLGDLGVFGFNYFNREINDVIDLVGTGDLSPGGLDVLRYENLSGGRAWGVELDFSMPLTMIGLENTNIFANYTWLNSEVTDPLTGQKRRFRDQPDYVYNVGVIQSIPDWNMTMGASYQKRGASYAYAFDEIEKTSYEGNLEAFVEKRFSDSFVIRLTGANLLDADKVENKLNYDPDLKGAFDGTEIETEHSGRLFLLTARKSF